MSKFKVKANYIWNYFTSRNKHFRTNSPASKMYVSCI